VAPALLILPSVLLLATGIAAASEEGGGLYPSACYLLWPTTGAVSHGHDHIKQGVGDGCSLDSCWREFKGPEGIKQCAYGRGSELDLAIKDSSKAAKQFVAEEIARSHMKRLKNKAYDLAGVFSNAKEGIEVMAVGKNIARLSLGAASDSDPSPTWPGTRKEVTEDAVLVALQLRAPGCPEDLAKCH
jgi:hypothetical protein